jgi:hypothetical protein
MQILRNIFLGPSGNAAKPKKIPDFQDRTTRKQPPRNDGFRGVSAGRRIGGRVDPARPPRCAAKRCKTGTYATSDRAVRRGFAGLRMAYPGLFMNARALGGEGFG